MNMDVELADWRTDWLANEAPDATLLRLDLRRLVDRKRRQMGLSLAGHLFFGVAMLVFSAWFASHQPTLEWILWAGVIWAGTLFAAGYAVWNKAGTWRALQQSNAAFLDLSRRRCLRELQAIHLGRWFLAVQSAIVMSWLSWDCVIHRLPVRPYLFGIAVTILVAAIYLIWFTAREHRIYRDLHWLDQID